MSYTYFEGDKGRKIKGKGAECYLDGIERIVNSLKMNWDAPADTKEKKSIPMGTSTVNNKPKLLKKPAKVPV